MQIFKVFSPMNYVISKLRNKMKLPVLNAILNIKHGLICIGKCSSTNTLPDSVEGNRGVKKYLSASSTAHSTSANNNNNNGYF